MDTRDSPKDAVEKGKEVLALCRQVMVALIIIPTPLF
jgi:hypothetical protein